MFLSGYKSLKFLVVVVLFVASESNQDWSACLWLTIYIYICTKNTIGSIITAVRH